MIPLFFVCLFFLVGGGGQGEAVRTMSNQYQSGACKTIYFVSQPILSHYPIFELLSLLIKSFIVFFDLPCKLIIFIFPQLCSMVKVTLDLNQKPWLEASSVTGCSSTFILDTTPLLRPLAAHLIVITFCANNSCLILTDCATFELLLGKQDRLIFISFITHDPT